MSRPTTIQYEEGYDWGLKQCLAGNKKQVENYCLIPIDPTDFDEGAMDAVKHYKIVMQEDTK